MSMSNPKTALSGPVLALVNWLVAALVWGGNAYQAATFGGEFPVQALGLILALTIFGVAVAGTLSSVVALVAAEWPMRPGASQWAEDRAWRLALATLLLGLAVQSVFGAAIGTWDWTVIVVGALGGGFGLGLATLGPITRRQAGLPPHLPPPVRR
jgi:hypothetical protein